MNLTVPLILFGVLCAFGVYPAGITALVLATISVVIDLAEAITDRPRRNLRRLA
jgi:hypothetical protein